ncbi:hypothetical protein AAG570_006710 [Ranatra chinensis]|uniref:Prefoldin subunit 1 n=1 Tax=Ranatra chinensis TaxID=642074 RepID=A0ABD0Z7J1_9HEMI
MSMSVDLELKKAFAELQHMMSETPQKLKLADVQIESLKRQRKHAEITTNEVKNLSSDTKTYESVGRMFVLTEIPTILDNLSSKMASCNEKIKALENNKAYLEKCMKESENNLREMVQIRKEKQDK